jgi:hypothetical protein
VWLAGGRPPLRRESLDGAMNSERTADVRFVAQAFLGEIEIEARYCVAAATEVEHALASRDVDETFRALHSLLAHAAMISKLLWPPKVRSAPKAARMRKRAEHLLQALSLPDDVCEILQSRTLRNHIEHFSERLDDWAALGPQGLMDRNIGPQSAFVGFGTSVKLRHYDPDTRTYYFGDEPFGIERIVQAARTLMAAVPAARVSAARAV